MQKLRANFVLFTLIMWVSGLLHTAEPIPSAVEVERVTADIRNLLLEQPKRNTGATAALLFESATAAATAAERYAYLREAIAQAVKVGDASVAILSLKALTDGFDVPELAERAELAIQLNKQVKGVVDAALTAYEAIAVCRLAVALGDQALVDRLVPIVTSLSPRHKDAALTAVSKDLAAWASEAISMQKSLPTTDLLGLASASDMTVLGRYHAFVMGDWVTGLPLLKDGDDAVIATLATKELSVSASENALSIADGWWAIAEKQRGLNRISLQQHAGDWYRRALKSASPLTLPRIEKRLIELPYDVLANPNAIDLWPLMSLAKGSYQGDWKNVNGALIVEKNETGDHLTIPIVPFGDYRFEIEFELLSEKGGIMTLLPLQTPDGPQSLNFFMYDSDLSLHRVNNETVRRKDPLGKMEPNKRYWLVTEVNQGQEYHIAIQRDGQRLFEWSGPKTTAISFHSKAKPTRPGALGIGAWAARIAFYHARFTQLSGRVGRLEELPR
jgi:hypothetical protein